MFLLTAQEIKWIERIVGEVFDLLGELVVFEVGCGRFWLLNLGDLRYRITGLDISEEVFYYWVLVVRDLDVVIFGDLRSASLLVEQFHIVYCVYVFEHIDGAREVLVNLDCWMCLGGLIILRVPDRSLVYGMVV